MSSAVWVYARKFCYCTWPSFPSTYLFLIDKFYKCLNLIGRGTRARLGVVKVEGSLAGGPCAMVDLHCVSSQISFFECSNQFYWVKVWYIRCNLNSSSVWDVRYIISFWYLWGEKFDILCKGDHTSFCYMYVHAWTSCQHFCNDRLWLVITNNSGPVVPTLFFWTPVSWVSII